LHGVDFIEGPDVLGQTSVLSAVQREEIISHCGEDEHVFIAYMTPVLSRLCANVGSIFVNSEELPWIHTPSNHPAKFLKPDAFSSALPVYSATKEHRTVGLGLLRRTLVVENFEDIYRIGCPIWDLRDTVVIWEFKWKVSNADRGTVYNYLVNLSRDDAFNTYYALLCDNVHFYIISAKNGNLTSHVQKYAWTTRGSVEALYVVLRHKNARQNLLEGLCRDLNLNICGFLGAGAIGRCFSVERKDEREVHFALKSVLTCQRSNSNECTMVELLTEGEFRKLEMLASTGMPVMPILTGSLRRVYHKDKLLGLGYVMAAIGEPIVSSRNKIPSNVLENLFDSLAILHQGGHYHGDCRVQNVVLVDGKVVWIDFVWGSSENCGEYNNRKKKEDMVSLIRSIYGEVILKTDEQLKELLETYAATLNNSREIEKYLEKIQQ
jgi:tRNA A-37 threonylcarbamoyl transferase component Bud32